jgi:tripartite ATP-independent transporter DctM subunit
MLGLAVSASLAVLIVIGVPVAFALGGVAIGLLVWHEGLAGLMPAADALVSSLEDFTLVSVPLFILMGVAASLSPAGGDMREMIKRWLHKMPGGLVVANICASTLFSALSSTGAATCLAVGREGLPELRERRYSDAAATGALAAAATLGILIPPSLTMIVYGIAGDFSIARLFLAGLLPGLALTLLFVLWAFVAARRWKGRFGGFARGYTRGEMMMLVPRAVPFIVLVAAVIYAFWSGIASPPEVAAVAAVACIVFVAVLYGMWRERDLLAILRESTRESVAVLIIIAAAALFDFALVRLGIPDTVAVAIADLRLPPFGLIALLNVLLFVAGLFLPPVAIILVLLPIILPLLLATGFDPYWFGVVMTLNFQIALLTPPVGANLHVVRHLAPDIRTGTIVRGALPYIFLIVAEIVLLCVIPEIATWLPDQLMGPAP